MAGALTLPLFGEMVPGGFSYGGNYLVEFEPASPWYEVSLTIALHALRHGIRTEYHTFRHMPSEIRTALERMGLDVGKVEKEGLFRILDTYRLTTGLDATETTGTPASFQTKSFDMVKWGSSILDMIKGGVPDSEKRWLHLDDDTSVLNQYTDENTFIDTWRTKGIPYARARELVQFPSLLRGAASDTVFAKFESFADGIIDFKSLEEKGEIKHYVRVRTIRSQACDTHWKLLSIHDNGEVGLGQLRASERTPSLTGLSEGTRKLAAIMFTDMVGYTALGQRDESLSLALVDEQRKLTRPILNRHNGREVKTMGDGFLAEFPSALEAVRCAYDIQRATREFNISLPSDRRVHLRVGVHLGDVVTTDGDISGDAVNVASRIEPLAEDGGVCLTRQVYDQVQNKFELTLTSMGSRTLKNVSLPVEIYKMVMPWEEKKPTLARQLDRKRIAVLPFQNISPDPADEYFSDGITEEVISTMSRISGLRVIARTSVMGYKGGKKKISDVARELEVGTVLEGSVRKAKDMVRIAVQLVDSHTSEHLWTETYDRELRDVLAIQSDIAKTVANSLEVQLLSKERDLMEKRQIVNPEAYTLYLKGRFYWDERTREGVNKALRYFEQAVKADPGFALGYSGQADCYTIFISYNWMDPRQAGPLARDLSLKALEIDESLAEAHASLALVLTNYSWDFATGKKELERAIEIRPNYALAHHWLSQWFSYHRRFEEAYLQEKLASDIDPHSLVIGMGMAMSLDLLGRTDEAMARYKELIGLYPDFEPLLFWKSHVHVLHSQNDDAVQEAEKLWGLGQNTYTELNLAEIYALTGRAREAREILDRVLKRAAGEYVSPAWVGMIELILGHPDEGFKWLERAVTERDSNLLEIGHLSWYEPYRADPRWRQIHAKLGITEI